MLNTIKTGQDVGQVFGRRVIIPLSMDIKITGDNNETLIESQYLEVGRKFREEGVGDGR